MHTIILIISKSVIKMEKITGWYKKNACISWKTSQRRKLKLSMETKNSDKVFSKIDILPLMEFLRSFSQNLRLDCAVDQLTSSTNKE